MRSSLLLIVLALGIQSCKKTPEPTTSPVDADNQILAKYLDLPNPAYDYENISVPTHLDVDEIYSNDNTPANNHNQ